ncbi:MAG: hypothetical protein BYD32DRAFT_419178 [Podila humilis]|nr:MAG: hypothetical protein BYD32DRAFT_419178 [Podila humilis]
MKLTISVALLVVVATHVAAVTPIPIPECTKTVIVQSTDTCNEMAESYGITFKDMLAWNEKLRRDCMNLDDDGKEKKWVLKRVFESHVLIVETSYKISDILSPIS